MSRICDICGKSYQRAKLVARGIGNRVTRRTTTRKGVNLRIKRLSINGKMVRVKLCASCLKRIMKDKKDLIAKEAKEVIEKETKETQPK